ncbi:tetratricopeptide repeat protein [Microbacterium sp. NPDC089987]|uniref:tetratricopeptide repeat protein n=1 Tax=Microbacterium sp. NPDC089987 TaxID=3364202 RepID=UPI00380FE77C
MDAESRLIAEAVVTYADSCTLPKLTPGCPYYRTEDGTPTCSEECRALSQKLGVQSRGEYQTQIGGLIMHGRAIPVRSAGGMRDYDATREYITDRDKEPRHQSTASLLLSLNNALVTNALTGTITRLDDALRLWGEAERRIEAIESVFHSGIAQQVASAVIVRVTLEYLNREGRVDIEDVIGAPEFDSTAGWWDAATLSAEDTARTIRRGHADTSSKRLLRTALPHLFDDEAELDELVQHPVIAHSLTSTFRRRVVRWLTNIMSVDLAGALSVRPPHAPLFAAHEPTPTTDPVGLWLWERFTVTRVEEWSAGSLALEWDWASNGSDVRCDSRAMAERVVDADTTSRLAMTRSLERYSGPVYVHGFVSSEYAERASNLLVTGQWEEASRIFEGLVELSPGDAEAWNNLGFCSLAADSEDAIVMLRRAEALSRTPSLLTAANIALALHLTGEDGEALKTAREALEWESPVGAGSAWLWEHPVADDYDAELALGDFPNVRDYLENLLRHIEEASCDQRPGSGTDVAVSNS